MLMPINLWLDWLQLTLISQCGQIQQILNNVFHSLLYLVCAPGLNGNWLMTELTIGVVGLLCFPSATTAGLSTKLLIVGTKVVGNQTAYNKKRSLKFF